MPGMRALSAAATPGFLTVAMWVSRLRRGGAFQSRRGRSDPPELLHGFPDRSELLDERVHAVLRVVELLRFLEDFRRARPWDDDHAVFVGRHDVAVAHADARAGHRHVDADDAVVVDGG